MTELETVLSVLSAPKVKKLCKELNIGPKGGQKHDGIEALIAHSKKKSFFASKTNPIASVILKKQVIVFQ